MVRSWDVSHSRRQSPAEPSVLSPVSPLPSALREGLSSPHLPGLDGLRMVAVMLVALFHFGFPAVPGSHGVLAFFVLSGFLITWLLLKEQERFGSISLRQFYLRRVLRIFPAFYAFWLLLTGVLLVLDKPIVWGQALSAFFYVNNYYQAIHGEINTYYSHTWTLGIEEQFYLLWPLALRALGRQPRRIATALVAVIGSIWVYRAMLHVGVGVRPVYIYEAFDTRADHLAMGCLLAVVLRNGYLPQLWRRLCTPPMSILVFALLVTSIGLTYAFGEGYRNVVGFAVDPLLVAVFIAQMISLREMPLWRWLNWRPVRYLGVLSYSIYLYQQVVVWVVREAFLAYPLPLQLGAALAAVILAAAASYHLVEQPFLRLKERIGNRSEPQAAAWRRGPEPVPARQG